MSEILAGVDSYDALGGLVPREFPQIEDMATPQTDAIAKAWTTDRTIDILKACRSFERQMNHAWLERNAARAELKVLKARP